MPIEPTPRDTVIRQKLAELIANSGRTQTDIATASNLPQSLVSGIMTGQRANLRAETVTRVGAALGLSPTALGKLLYGAIEGEK